MSNRMSSPEAVHGQRGPGASWWLPAGTFLAGCLLGAVVMGVGDVGGADPAAGSAAPSAADEQAGEDRDGTTGDEAVEGGAGAAGTDESPVSVRVPESCAQTADDATALLEQVDDVVAAVGQLDPERLRQAVDDVQRVRDDVQGVAEQCQQAAAEAQVDVADADSGGVDDDSAEPVVDDPAPSPAS